MTVAVIDLDAYRHNIALLAARMAPAELMVMVKADAYGHGLLPVALTALDCGIRSIGVLDAESGLALRSAGIGSEVRLFAWLFSTVEDYRPLIEADIDLGISHLHQLERIAAANASRRARLHLKIDTGLHRNGATVEEWPLLVGRALQLQASGVVELYGAWTHIGEASDREDTVAIERFDRAIAEAQSLGASFSMRHLAASAAAFARGDARYDTVRVGAFTYGIAPGGGIGPATLNLRPVMSLQTEVLEVIGSGSRRFARIPVGFTDGVPAAAAGRVSVSLAGIRMPLVSVGPGHSEIDVSGGPASVGDGVVLFGTGDSGEQTLQEWADALDTIGEELAVRVGPRIPRQYRRTL